MFLSPAGSLELVNPHSGLLKIIYSQICVQGRVIKGFAELVLMFGSPVTS